MEKKRNLSMAALISIEPEFVKMRISKLKNDILVDIERLEKHTNLGHEIFNNRKISFETLREISEILKNYSQILTEYNINNFRVIASNILNDAQNCAYIIDQIKIQNNMHITVLEDRPEKSFIYFEILKTLEKAGFDNLDKTLISYIEAGSIGFSIYDKKKILFSQNVDIGPTKLYELLDPVSEQMCDFSSVVEEYLDRIIGRIHFPINRTNIENLIISGSEIELIASLCGAKEKNGIFDINLRNIDALYSEIEGMSAQMISEKYHISLKNAQLLFTVLAMYSKVLNLTNAKKILCPKVELWDALIKQILSSKLEKQFEAHVYSSAVCCAKILSYHFYFSQPHVECTYQYATLIFDKLKKLHGLNKRKKLLLDLAIILHEAGYYVNSKDPRISTFDIIKNLEIYGMTDKDVILMANIVRYNEFTAPSENDIEYAKLSSDDKLMISKMVAIFRLCNALDKSKKQKLKNMKIKISDKNFIISVESDENAYLEKWAIEKCNEFFEEVFGLKVKLMVKSKLL